MQGSPHLFPTSAAGVLIRTGVDASLGTLSSLVIFQMRIDPAFSSVRHWPSNDTSPMDHSATAAPLYLYSGGIADIIIFTSFFSVMVYQTLVRSAENKYPRHLFCPSIYNPSIRPLLAVPSRFGASDCCPPFHRRDMVYFIALWLQLVMFFVAVSNLLALIFFAAALTLPGRNQGGRS